MARARQANAFSLRLPRTTRADAEFQAKCQGVSMNTFILAAVAEKIERLGAIHARPEKSKPPHAERRSDHKKRPGSTRVSGRE